MKQIKAVLIAFAIFGISFGISHAGSFRYICSNGSGHFFEFPDLGDATYFSVIEPNSTAERVIRRGGRVRLPRSFTIFTVWTYTEGDSGFDPVWQYEISPAVRCGDGEAPIAVNAPLYNCLEGISEETIKALLGYTPTRSAFKVDNTLYPYGWELSFLVDADVRWRWDLYVDDKHIITFEQREDMPCQVVELYPQQ